MLLVANKLGKAATWMVQDSSKPSRRYVTVTRSLARVGTPGIPSNLVLERNKEGCQESIISEKRSKKGEDMKLTQKLREIRPSATRTEALFFGGGNCTESVSIYIYIYIFI